MKPTRSNVRSLLNSDQRFLTFAGNETFLLFQQGYPLRDFSAFEVLADDEAWDTFERELLVPILDAAAESKMGILTDTLCWRAHPDAVEQLGYSRDEVDRFNRLGVSRIADMIDRWKLARGLSESSVPAILAAEIGPRGDGYTVSENGKSSIDEARSYHTAQVESIAQTGAHLAVALTMTQLSETIGLVLAAKSAQLPIAVSPTVETDGRLPDGSSLGSFIEEVDSATEGYVAFYMINCAHPTHVTEMLGQAKAQKARWLNRLRGFRANASCKSHEELDNATTLDRGHPCDLADRTASLAREFDLNVLGGCCGTDSEHIRLIGKAVTSAGIAHTH